jgi:hypothetical protein
MQLLYQFSFSAASSLLQKFPFQRSTTIAASLIALPLLLRHSRFRQTLDHLTFLATHNYASHALQMLSQHVKSHIFPF